MPDRDQGWDGLAEQMTDLISGIGKAWGKTLTEMVGAELTQDGVTLFKGFREGPAEPAPDESPTGWLSTIVSGAIEEAAPYLTMEAAEAIVEAAETRARGLGMTLRPR